MFFYSQTDQAHGNLAWGSHFIKILCRLVAKHLSLCLATETVKCVNTKSEDPTLNLLALLAQMLCVLALLAQLLSPNVNQKQGERKRAAEKERRSRNAIQIQIVHAAFLPLCGAGVQWLGEVSSILQPDLPFHHTHTPAHCQVCPVSALTDFAVDAYRKLALFLSLSFSPSLSSIFFLPLSLCLDHLSLLGRSIRCTDSALVIGPPLSIISCSSKDTLQLNTI